MKITVLGAGSFRSPLLLNALHQRQKELNLTGLALMDTDVERADTMLQLARAAEPSLLEGVPIQVTDQKEAALSGASFVLTTFRPGGMQARIIDETIPLQYDTLGQETTGPGGFSMSLRSIPALLEYITIMQQVCPKAWLVNFANPSGLLTEAVHQLSGWTRMVGICDAPSSMKTFAARFLKVPEDEVFLDYYGLNHLGWVRKVLVGGDDILPGFMEGVRNGLRIPGLPFSARLLSQLGLVPNEYLVFYYKNREVVRAIKEHGKTRGEELLAQNQGMYSRVQAALAAGDPAAALEAYRQYLQCRWRSYMATESGADHTPGSEVDLNQLAQEGYTAVALDLIEALCGKKTRVLTVNVINQGAIEGMDERSIVEVPAVVSHNCICPLAVGAVKAETLELMQRVKNYENLAIQAVKSGSFTAGKAALRAHPLVRDGETAELILRGYQQSFGKEFLPNP